MKKELLNDIIQWDVKSWSKALEFWENNVDWNKVDTCLELGGRDGGLSLWLSLKGKNVICSDYIDVKLKAEKLHQKYNLNHKISYQDIVATNIPYENHFDLIVFKSIIGVVGRNNNIELQKKAFEEIRKALKPGGKLLFAENLVASPLHQKLRKKHQWSSYWRYVTIEEMELFLKHFSKKEIKTNGFLGVLGRNESQRNFLSSIDNIVLNTLFPDKWKYIVYGIAEK